LQGKCCRDLSASIQASSRLYMPKKLKLFGWTDGREENNIPRQLRCEGIINITRNIFEAKYIKILLQEFKMVCSSCTYWWCCWWPRPISLSPWPVNNVKLCMKIITVINYFYVLITNLLVALIMTISLIWWTQ